MPHHLVFSYLPPPPPGSSPAAKPPRQKEVWITYPMISHCCLRPSSIAARVQPSIRLRCRDFTFFAFNFLDDKQARDVYDSIRALSCKVGRLDRLLAFSYQPKPPEDQFNGWQIYDARREWKRLGISPKDTDKGWRVSEINAEYKVHITCRAPFTYSDIFAVFANLPRSHRRSHQSLRQRTEICRRVPLSTPHTRPCVPSSHQQLLHNAQLTAATRSPRQSEPAG